MRNAAEKTKKYQETADEVFNFQENFQKPNAQAVNANQRKIDARMDKKNSKPPPITISKKKVMKTTIVFEGKKFSNQV